jgi:hypothetical protein
MNHTPHPDWTTRLRVTVATATFRPSVPWKPAPDATVTLRGALGLAMLDLACVAPQPACVPCRHRATCPIPTWFSPDRLGGSDLRPWTLRVAHAQVVTPEAPLRARLTLLGEVPRPDLVTAALERMGRMGLGADRVPHTLQDVHVQGEGSAVRVCREGETIGRFPAPAALGRLLPFTAGPVASAWVTLRSPLQLKDQNPHRPPTLARLLDAAVQRVHRVASAQGVYVSRRWPDYDLARGEWVEARFVRGTRWSQRQGQHQDLSGWVGQIHLQDPEPWLDVLLAAEVLGLGRGTSAGLGSVQVDVDPPSFMEEAEE